MYSESVAMTGYAKDASFTFDVRIARFPETGSAALWFYVYAAGEQYALVDETVTTGTGKTAVDLPDAGFSVSGSATATLAGRARDSDRMTGMLTARGHLHQNAHPPHGTGDTLVQIEAQITASHAPIVVRAGRLEVMGDVRGTVRIGNQAHTFAVPGKWHEQTGDRPSFAPAFTYLFLQGEGTGLMATRHARGAWGYLFEDGQTRKLAGIDIEPYGQPVRKFVASLDDGRTVTGAARIIREVSVPIEGARRPGAAVLADSDIGPLVGVLNDWQPDER